MASIKDIQKYLNEQIRIEDYFNQWIAPKNPGLGMFPGKIVCPFHADVNPSLGIIPGTNIFNCFGCSAHGTLVDFHAKLRGIDGEAAVKELVKLYSVKTEEVVETKVAAKSSREARIEEMRAGYLTTSYARDIARGVKTNKPVSYFNQLLARKLSA